MLSVVTFAYIVLPLTIKLPVIVALPVTERLLLALILLPTTLPTALTYPPTFELPDILKFVKVPTLVIFGCAAIVILPAYAA